MRLHPHRGWYQEGPPEGAGERCHITGVAMGLVASQLETARPSYSNARGQGDTTRCLYSHAKDSEGGLFLERPFGKSACLYTADKHAGTAEPVRIARPEAVV